MSLEIRQCYLNLSRDSIFPSNGYEANLDYVNITGITKYLALVMSFFER